MRGHSEITQINSGHEVIEYANWKDYTDYLQSRIDHNNHRLSQLKDDHIEALKDEVERNKVFIQLIVDFYSFNGCGMPDEVKRILQTLNVKSKIKPPTNQILMLLMRIFG